MAKVVAKFEKVSFEQFKEACIKTGMVSEDDKYIRLIYNNIKLPKRSTKRSSGYDFYLPSNHPVILVKGESLTIPTGIRCVFLEDGYDLSIYPRSGMGFKYRVHLDNCVGIIDNDYAEAKNEGHIMVKLSCDPRQCNEVVINPGDKFVQGIIREFFLAEEDEINEIRTGGMGSTGV